MKKYMMLTIATLITGSLHVNAMMNRPVIQDAPTDTQVKAVRAKIADFKDTVQSILQAAREAKQAGNDARAEELHNLAQELSSEMHNELSTLQKDLPELPRSRTPLQ